MAGAKLMPAATVAATPAQEPAYDKYEAENDLRHLTEAKRIAKDPRRMKHAKRAATEKLAEMDHMRSIAAGK